MKVETPPGNPWRGFFVFLTRSARTKVARVASIDRWAFQDANVHNLTVSDIHTYY